MTAVNLTITASNTERWITSQAYDVVSNYTKTERFDPVEIAESSNDAEDMLTDALDEDTGEPDMIEFVDEHGGDGRDALLEAFHNYIDVCVGLAAMLDPE